MGDWRVFTACMFLGLGIGMLFGEAGAGIIVGMGVGFLLEGITSKPKASREERVGREVETVLEKTYESRVLGSLVLILIGVGFIVGGLSMADLISLPDIVWRSIGAVFMIAIGLLFLVLALHTAKK